MDKKKDAISTLLNITPMIKENGVVLHADKVETHTQVDEDIQYAREMIYKNIQMGQDALEEILEIAKQSQHPKAFDTVALLLNTNRAAAKDLISIQRDKKELSREDPQGPSTVNNNMFVGSTAEIMKMLKEKKNERDET